MHAFPDELAFCNSCSASEPWPPSAACYTEIGRQIDTMCDGCNADDMSPCCQVELFFCLDCIFHWTVSRCNQQSRLHLLQVCQVCQGFSSPSVVSQPCHEAVMAYRATLPCPGEKARPSAVQACNHCCISHVERTWVTRFLRIACLLALQSKYQCALYVKV